MLCVAQEINSSAPLSIHNDLAIFTIIYTKHNEGSLRYCIMFFPTLWINQCGNDLQEKKVTMKQDLEPKQKSGDKGHNGKQKTSDYWKWWER